MKWILVVAVGLVALDCGAQTAPLVADTTPSELAAHLRQWADALQHETVPSDLRALPSAWTVHTPDGDYSIATAPLRQETGDKDHTPNWMEAAARLNHLAGQLESFRTVRSYSPEIKRRLGSILKRPEFAATASSHQPEWQKRWAAFVQKMLESLFGAIARHSGDSWIVFYFVLAAALGAIGFFVYRFVRGRATYDTLAAPQDRSAGELRAWQRWLREAQAAAAEGDFRRAIQCAYWTGVTRLQESGELPRETTYTPREYLRLCKGSVAQSDTLRTLTNYLERFWYARGVASVNDVQTCLGSLAVLDCRVE